jgi:hypothetical protein
MRRESRHSCRGKSAILLLFRLPLGGAFAIKVPPVTSFSIRSPIVMSALIIDKETNCHPVHVLIVCVGWYGQHIDGKQVPSNNISPLDGIEHSAVRLTHFWIDADNDKRLINRELGSVQLLVSATDPSFTFNEKSPVPATSANVEAAISTWLHKCKTEGALGILHWIGHGITPVEVGSHVAGIQMLCEDSHLEALNVADMAKMFNAMDQGKIPNNCILFIDACRERYTGSEEAIKKINMLGAFRTAPRKKFKDSACIFRLSDPGDKALMRPRPDNAIGFRGGAVMSEALLDAFQHYAMRRQPTGSASVDIEELEAAIATRFVWWRSLFKGIRIPRFQRAWSKRPDMPHHFLRIIEPRAMLDLDIRDRAGASVSTAPYLSKVDVRCRIAKNGAPPQVHSPPLPLTQHGGSWRREVEPGVWCYFATEGDVDVPPHRSGNVQAPGICPAVGSSGFPDEENNGRVWEL